MNSKIIQKKIYNAIKRKNYKLIKKLIVDNDFNIFKVRNDNFTVHGGNYSKLILSKMVHNIDTFNILLDSVHDNNDLHELINNIKYENLYKFELLVEYFQLNFNTINIDIAKLYISNIDSHKHMIDTLMYLKSIGTDMVNFMYLFYDGNNKTILNILSNLRWYFEEEKINLDNIRDLIDIFELNLNTDLSSK